MLNGYESCHTQTSHVAHKVDWAPTVCLCVCVPVYTYSRTHKRTRMHTHDHVYMRSYKYSWQLAREVRSMCWTVVEGGAFFRVREEFSACRTMFCDEFMFGISTSALNRFEQHCSGDLDGPLRIFRVNLRKGTLWFTKIDTIVRGQDNPRKTASFVFFWPKISLVCTLSLKQPHS